MLPVPRMVRPHGSGISRRHVATAIPIVMPSLSDRDGSRRPPPWRGAWPLTSYLLIALLSGVAWVCFFVLNRTRVRRAQPVSAPCGNTLFISNHQSTLDTLLVALAACHPRCWLAPRFLPWSLAAAEVYFRTPVTAWFANQLRCVPVRRDRRDPLALRRILHVLPSGTTIYFPEGRRSRTGELGEASPAAGWIALVTGAQVIPVAIDGMNEVVRFERFGLRFFRRMGVSVGPALDLSAYRGRDPSRAAAREVTALMMASIARELDVAREVRGGHADRERNAR
jgi:1-acyl-sn-glycerol-3-phosphate acyltransferase